MHLALSGRESSVLDPVEGLCFNLKSPVLAISGAPRVSEGDHPAGLQAAQSTQVIDRSLPVEQQGGSVQTDAAQSFAAHFRQAGEHMLDPSTGPGDAGIAPVLAVGQRFAWAGFTLNMHPPARCTWYLKPPS